MKAIKLLPQVVLFCGGMLTLVQAQLVHLAFRDFDGVFIFRANSAEIPWNLTTGQISRLDIYYDPSEAPGGFLDPSKNVWRALVTSPLGNFTITRPITSFDFSKNSLSFQYFSVDPEPYGRLEFSTAYSPPSLNFSPPIPPFSLEDSSLYLSGGRSFYDIPNLGEGYGYGGFDHAKAEVVAGAGLSPVPEPGIYGVCGAGVLMALALWRRRAGVHVIAPPLGNLRR